MPLSPPEEPEQPTTRGVAALPLSLRFVAGYSLVLIILYQIGAALLLGIFDHPLAGLLLVGPVFVLLPLAGGLRRARIPLAETLRLRPASLRSVLLGSAAVVAALPAILAVTARLTPDPGPAERFLEELLRARTGLELAAVLVVAALVPAVTEEILFRGFLQKGLEERLGQWPGILIGGAAFGLIHGPVRAPTAAALGILLGWLASRSGSILPAVGAHATVNTLAVMLVNVEDGSIAPEGSDVIPVGTALLWAVVSCALFCAFGRMRR